MTGVTEKFTTSDIGKNKENIPETTIRVHQEPVRIPHSCTACMGCMSYPTARRE